jgi:hypothetical protein
MLLHNKYRMSETPVVNKVTQSKLKKFQSDPNDPSIHLVPVENLQSVPTVSISETKLKKNINLNEVERERRKQQGQRLGELSKQRALDRKNKKIEDEIALRALEEKTKQEEAKKMQDEINKKIAEGKLIRVSVKPKLTRQKREVIPKPIEQSKIIETETEDDSDEEDRRKVQRSKRREAIKISQTLKTIDETIAKVTKGKYFDQLNASWL